MTPKMILQHSLVVCFLLLLGLTFISVFSQQLIDDSCGEGWKAYERKKCFQLLKNPYPRKEAKKQCNHLAGTTGKLGLATISSKDEQAFITKNIIKKENSEDLQNKGKIWIGAMRKSNQQNFEWPDTAHTSLDRFKNWDDNEPSKPVKHLDCAYMVSEYPPGTQNPGKIGKWRTGSCDLLNYVLCEKDFPKDSVPTTTLRPTTTKKPDPNAPSLCKGQDWFEVTGGTCFKYSVTFRPTVYDDAVKFCKETPNGEESGSKVKSRIAFIKTLDEQSSLILNLYKKSMDWSVWIGARRVPGTNRFIWADGNEMTWNHWAANEPNNEAGNDCVEMSADGMARTTDAYWRAVKCNKPNRPLCQKIPNWSPEKLKQTIQDLQKAQDEAKRKYAETAQKLEKTAKDLKETAEKLEKTKAEIKETNSHQKIINVLSAATAAGLKVQKIREKRHWKQTKKEIDDLKTRTTSSLPIGFIYVQLPHQADPNILFPDTNWQEISPEYAGVFFRVIGRNSAPFETTQEAKAPHLNQVNVYDYNGTTFKTHLDPGKCGMVNSNYGTSKASAFQFCLSGGEVRPRNMAIKVWKRTG